MVLMVLGILAINQFYAAETYKRIQSAKLVIMQTRVITLLKSLTMANFYRRLKYLSTVFKNVGGLHTLVSV